MEPSVSMGGFFYFKVIDELKMVSFLQVMNARFLYFCLYIDSYVQVLYLFCRNYFICLWTAK